MKEGGKEELQRPGDPAGLESTACLAHGVRAPWQRTLTWPRFLPATFLPATSTSPGPNLGLKAELTKNLQGRGRLAQNHTGVRV